MLRWRQKQDLLLDRWRQQQQIHDLRQTRALDRRVPLAGEPAADVGVRARGGLPGGQPWTRQRVLQQLRRLCPTGYDLGSHLNRSRKPALHGAALHHFGSWRAALTAAGINLANVSRRRPKHLDRELMILWLQQRRATGQSLSWTAVCLENRGYALAIRRVFRSWREAVAAAEGGKTR